MTNVIQRIEEAVIAYIGEEPATVQDLKNLRLALTDLIKLGKFAYQKCGSIDDCRYVVNLYYGALDRLGIDWRSRDVAGNDDMNNPNRIDNVHDADLDLTAKERLMIPEIFAQATPLKSEKDLTPEEREEERKYLEEMDRISKVYGKLRTAYEAVIALEEDTKRKAILLILLEELNEEN